MFWSVDPPVCPVCTIQQHSYQTQDWGVNLSLFWGLAILNGNV